MHEIVKGEIESGGESTWQETMSRSFSKMDQEIADLTTDAAAGAAGARSSCRCELKSLHCDAGSTAVVAVVTPENIVVSNCGDSRAVLCRNGVAVPLSFDHKVNPQKSRNFSRRKLLNNHIFVYLIVKLN